MTKNFIQKFIVCFLAGLLMGIAIVRIGLRFLYARVPSPAILVTGLLMIAIPIFYSFAWQGKKEQDGCRTERIFSFWVGVIRFSIALDLIMVGLQKWFGLQFNTPLAKLDLPFSNFSSEDLAWAFFGHSNGFILVIGSLQILGSLFLLYSRTRLLGTVVLIPVLLNITLMDLFYQFNFGEWFNALAHLLALIYLLLLDYEKLATIFLRSKGSHPIMFFKNKWAKNCVRFSAFCIPLLMIWIDPNPYRHDWFMGKYKVERLFVNQVPLQAVSCTDSVLTTVYFDQGNECVFECNGFDRRSFGSYHFNEANSRITVIWHYPKTMRDTLFASLQAALPDKKYRGEGSRTRIILNGKMGKDFIQVELKKLVQ